MVKTQVIYKVSFLLERKLQNKRRQNIKSSSQVHSDSQTAVTEAHQY